MAKSSKSSAPASESPADSGEGAPPINEFEGTPEGDPVIETPAADSPGTGPAPMEPGHEVRDGVLYLNEPCLKCGGTGTRTSPCKTCGADHTRACENCDGTGKTRAGQSSLAMISRIEKLPGANTKRLAAVQGLGELGAIRILDILAKHGVIEATSPVTAKKGEMTWRVIAEGV